MCFLDIDDIEMRDVAILLIDTIELGNSRAERRSSVASEDQNNRLRSRYFRKPNHTIAVE